MTRTRTRVAAAVLAVVIASVSAVPASAAGLGYTACLQPTVHKNFTDPHRGWYYATNFNGTGNWIVHTNSQAYQQTFKKGVKYWFDEFVIINCTY